MEEFMQVVRKVREENSNWKRKFRTIRVRLNGKARGERRATRDFFLKQMEFDSRMGIKTVKHLLETDVAYTGRIIGVGRGQYGKG